VSGAPADHKIHAGSYLRVTENAGKRYADCVLCFALDQTSYLHAIEV